MGVASLNQTFWEDKPHGDEIIQFPPTTLFLSKPNVNILSLVDNLVYIYSKTVLEHYLYLFSFTAKQFLITFVMSSLALSCLKPTVPENSVMSGSNFTYGSKVTFRYYLHPLQCHVVATTAGRICQDLTSTSLHVSVCLGA